MNTTSTPDLAPGTQHTNFKGTYVVTGEVEDGNLPIRWLTGTDAGMEASVDARRQKGILIHFLREASAKSGTHKIALNRHPDYAFTLGMICQTGHLHADLKPGPCEAAFRGDYRDETGGMVPDEHVTEVSNPGTWGNRLSVSAPYARLSDHSKYFDVTEISGTQMDDNESKVCANAWVMNLINMGFRLGVQDGEAIYEIMSTHGDPTVRAMAEDFLDGYTEDLDGLFGQKVMTA